MERIKIGDTIIPVKNIDSVFVDNYDRKKFSIHTLGNYTFVFNFQTEKKCKKCIDEVLKIIDDYLPEPVTIRTENDKEKED